MTDAHPSTAAHLTLWDNAACACVHAATLRVLAESGVEVLGHASALEVFAALGADVQGTRVRLRPEHVEAALATAPRTWTLRARGSEDGERDRSDDLELTQGRTYFGTGSDTLYVRDPRSGERRRVLLTDVETFAALCERLPNIDFVMSMGLPEDVPHELDDVAPVAAMLAGTRKPLWVAPRDGAVISLIQEMAAACGAADSFGIYAMPSPPLQHDVDALTKLEACARLQVPVVYAPAPHAGASAPLSVAGVVTVGNAEVLSGLVYHQAVAPGAPFVYGTGYGALSMRTMVDCYAAPEHFLGNQAGADLARFYGLPSFNYAAVSDSKLLDEQAAAEAGMTTILGALSRATLLHDVGYLESGLQSSAESIVLGDELVGWARAFMREVAVDDEALAVDEIVEVGPGGSHLARPYTRRHVRDAWQTSLLDQTVHDRWLAAGGSSLGERLREKTAALLAAPRPFTLDTTVLRTLDRILLRAEELGR
jgi:trimethylamine--corrinoid protein Co-methyltransferase